MHKSQFKKNDAYCFVVQGHIYGDIYSSSQHK